MFTLKNIYSHKSMNCGLAAKKTCCANPKPQKPHPKTPRFCYQKTRLEDELSNMAHHGTNCPKLNLQSQACALGPGSHLSFRIHLWQNQKRHGLHPNHHLDRSCEHQTIGIWWYWWYLLNLFSLAFYHFLSILVCLLVSCPLRQYLHHQHIVMIVGVIEPTMNQP